MKNIILIALLIGSITYVKAHENLIGVRLDYEKSEITISVVSSGCTKATDFDFEWLDNELTVVRKRKDDCKAMEEVLSFTYSFTKAGIDANKVFILKNHFIANPMLARVH